MTIWYRWNMANPRECGVGWPSFVFRESFSSPNFSYMMIRFSWEIALLKGRHILQQGQFEAIQNLQVDKIYCRKYLPTSDKFELKFSSSSRAEGVLSWAEPGHFNFQAETELTKVAKFCP